MYVYIYIYILRKHFSGIIFFILPLRLVQDRCSLYYLNNIISALMFFTMYCKISRNQLKQALEATFVYTLINASKYLI